MILKVGDLVQFKTRAISGKWEIKKIKKGYAKLVVPNTNEELNLLVEIEALEKVKK